MASNFQAHVTAVLKDTSSVTAQLQRLGKTPIKLANVTIDTQKIVNQLKSALSMAGMNLNNTGLNTATKKTGQQAGKNIQRGVQTGITNISKSQKQLTKEFESNYNKAIKGVQTGKFTAEVAKQRAQYQKLLNYDHPDVQSGKIGAQIAEMDNLARSMATYSSQGEAGANNLVKAFKRFNDVQSLTHNQIKTVNSDMALFANQKAVASTQKQLATFMNSGTIASKKYGGEIRSLSTQLDYLANRGLV